MESWTRRSKISAQVLQIDPQSGAAYTNLGVVYMRRKQWDKALSDAARKQSD